MKFKKPIEVQAGISDGDPTNPLGQAGYLLSSDGSNVNWVSPGGLSAETAEAIVQPIKANEALTKGDPLYIVGYQLGQDVNIVAKADSSDVAKMPVVGLADDDYANQAFGTMTAFGSFNGAFDTSGGTEGWSVGDIIFVKPLGGLTNIKPGGTDLIQNVAIVSRVSTQTGELEVIALGRTNDVPNLPTGRLFVGTAANTSLASDVVYVDDTNGRVGIETTSPAHTLSINGTVSSNFFRGYTYPDNSFLDFDKDDAAASNFTALASVGRIAYLADTNTNEPAANAAHEFFTGTSDIDTATSLMVIETNGNVGIGTTSPINKLDVNGVIRGEQYLILADTAGTNRFSIRAESNYGTIDNGSNTLNYNANNHLFLVGLSEKMRIDSSGNVGIGTTSPAGNLHVVGASGNSGRIYLSDKDNGVGGGQALLLTKTGVNSYIYNRDSGDLRLGTNDQFSYVTIKPTGNVGIGTTSPGARLEVQGGATLSAVAFSGPTVKIGDYSGIGNTRIFSNGSYIGYSTANSYHDFSNAGSSQMRITSSGNVGIGTTSPRGKLDVTNGSTGQTYSNISGLLIDVNGTSNSYYGLRVGSSTGNSHLAVTNAGNVGIGTTSPSEKLEVNGNIQAIGSRTISATFDANNYMRLESNSSGGILKGADGGVVTTLVRTYGDSYFNGGNVGIGTTSPDHLLQVESSGNAEIQAQRIAGAGVLIQAQSAVGVVGTNTNHRLDLKTNNTTRATISTSGNVGIGTSNPATKLHVSGGDIRIDDTERIEFGAGGVRINNDAAGRMYYNAPLAYYWQAGSGYKMVLHNSGNVGIGTTSPGSLLEVKGSTNSTTSNLLRLVREVDSSQPHKVAAFYSGVNERGSITVNSFATAYNTSSDYRLKENIKSIDNSVDRLMSLNPCSFNFKSKDKNKLVIDGFIAHEAQEVVPEAVTGLKDAIDKNGDPIYQGVDQSKLIPLLTAALQEAIERIKALENKINK